MKKSIVIIGVFSTVVTVFFTIFVVRATNIVGTSSYKLYAEMDNATGLLKETKVLIAGVKAGKIKDIELKNNRVLLTLEINGTFKIPHDSLIKKTPEGLLGASYLEIIPGEGTFLDDGATLKNTSSKDFMGSFGESSEQITENMQEITRRVSNYLAQTALFETLDSIANELNVALTQVNNLLGTVQDSAKKNSETIDTILLATAEIAKTMEYFFVNDTEVPNAELSVSLSAIRETLENIAGITKELNEGKGDLGKLLKSEELYHSLLDTSTKLSSTVDTINTAVTPIANIQSSFDYRFENLISEDARYTAKNHINLGLSPQKSSQKYLIGVTHGGGEKIEGDSASTSSIGSTDVKLNLLLGQELNTRRLVIYGGLIENTGGFRLDYIPFNEWVLSSEAYNFGGRNGANLRVLTQVLPFVSLKNVWSPLRGLYINGGVDDILENYKRTYFLGIGVNFKNYDLLEESQPRK